MVRTVAHDFRDGRLLVFRRLDVRGTTEVYIGLTWLDRMYVKIPSIPRDLAASAWYCGTDYFFTFLGPISEEEAESLVRVICVVQSKSKIGAFVYSSATGNWGHSTSFGIEAYGWLRSLKLMRRHYAHGRFYWPDPHLKYMLVLDSQEMKFSVTDFPTGGKGIDKVLVELSDDRLGLLVLAACVLDVHVKSLQDDGDGANYWCHDRAVDLLLDFHWDIRGEIQGCVLLRGIRRNYTDQFRSTTYNKPDNYYFTLDLKTFLIEVLCVMEYYSFPGCLYATFPPPLAPLSI